MTPRQRSSPLARLLAIVAIALAGVVAWAPEAAAHAGFVSSDPADGQTLATAPDAITIRFTEPPDPAISQITVVDTGGRPVEVGALARVGPDGLRASLPSDLPDGTYTVTWFAVSTVDGHLTTDAFAFGVGDTVDVPTGTSAPSSPDPTAAGIIGRAAMYTGLAVLIAAAFVGAWAFGMRPRSLTLVAVTGGVLTLGGALALVASEVDLIGTSTRAFLASDTGAPFVRLSIAAAATAALAVVAAARTTPMTLTIAGTAAVVTAWARAASGHADGLVQELGQTVHLAAVGVWIGGLVLVALLLRETRDGEPPVDAVRRFSTLALGAVALVIATGSLRAVQEIGGFGAFTEALDTGYGQVLAVKVGLALVLVALGAVNRRRSIPRIAAGDRAPLGRIVRAELVVALGLALLTGALTSLPPGGVDRSTPSPPPSISAEGSDFGTTVRVMLTASPGAPGSNTFAADVTDYDSGAPAPVDGVTLRFARADDDDGATVSLELRPDGDRWTGEGAGVSIAGTWNVTAQVRTGGGVVDVPLVLTTRTPGAESSVVEIPDGPDITTVVYPDGRSAQLYVDPGSPGPNQVHVTVFDAAGQELQLQRASLVVVPPGEPAARADVLRFDTGHFVANLELGGGTWIFDFTAVPVDGDPVQATLRSTIGGSA